jgi:hypothetical protein
MSAEMIPSPCLRALPNLLAFGHDVYNMKTSLEYLKYSKLGLVFDGNKMSYY